MLRSLLLEYQRPSGVNSHMHLKYFFSTLHILIASIFLTACQSSDFGQITSAPSSLLSMVKDAKFASEDSEATTNNQVSAPLGDILEGSLDYKNQGSDFLTTLKYALDTDPNIISSRRDIEAKLAVVKSNKAQKDFQVGTTLYGGIEDVTDNTKGAAISVDVSKLVFDGGKLDSQVASTVFAVEAAKMNLLASIDARAFELCQIWLELDKYRTLQEQIDKRLAVLEPLIEQLEQVAKAGVGDVSKVTAAQRTVSAIRVEQTNISESLAQAELEFSNAYGMLSNDINFDYNFISGLVPEKIDDRLVQSAPMLLSQYANYQADMARVRSLEAKRGFDVGFEVRAMRPFAGSGRDSDESVGLVGRKTLFNGGLLESEIQEAEALVEARAAQIKATYRKGSRTVQTAVQNIRSMDKAILLARENSKLTADEIIYLRQQLIIGGSTLDSVLSAEARLYEAESKEINFLTEKYKSQLIVVSSLGLLSKSMGF